MEIVVILREITIHQLTKDPLKGDSLKLYSFFKSMLCDKKSFENVDFYKTSYSSLSIGYDNSTHVLFITDSTMNRIYKELRKFNNEFHYNKSFIVDILGLFLGKISKCKLG